MKRENKSSLSEKILLDAAKSTLDDSVNEIDDDARARLRQARQQAVDVARSNQPQRATKPFWLVPASGFAVLALTLSAIFITWNQPEEDRSAMAHAEDLQLLSSPEDLELYEDLEFYQWLIYENEGLG